jgi:hypothetical protein
LHWNEKEGECGVGIWFYETFVWNILWNFSFSLSRVGSIPAETWSGEKLNIKKKKKSALKNFKFLSQISKFNNKHGSL